MAHSAEIRTDRESGQKLVQLPHLVLEDFAFNILLNFEVWEAEKVQRRCVGTAIQPPSRFRDRHVYTLYKR